MSYQTIKDRLYHGHRVVAPNTKLELQPNDLLYSYDKERIIMTLYGNKIAEYRPSHITLYSAGYPTDTTKRRLTLALLLAKVNGYIYQRNNCWYFSRNEQDFPFEDGMMVSY
jgi:hypothetical protein